MTMSQTDTLLNHFTTLRARGAVPSISNIEAQALFKIRALPRRISDLEARGHRFERERRVDTTGQRYVRYVHLG
jgi:hypothetical protein